MILFTVGGSPRCPTGPKCPWFDGTVIPGQLAGRVRRNAGNLFSPGRRFGLIIFQTQHIIPEFIKTPCMAIKKFVIMEVFFDHHMGHGDEQGGVCPRSYGDPLFSQFLS
jgi:hypothetical protein